MTVNHEAWQLTGPCDCEAGDVVYNVLGNRGVCPACCCVFATSYAHKRRTLNVLSVDVYLAEFVVGEQRPVFGGAA